jgi:hypothetical protein
MSDSNSSDDEVPYVGTHMVMGPGRSHIFGIKNEIVKLLPNIVPDIKLPNINLSNIDSVIKPQMDANSIEFNPNDTFKKQYEQLTKLKEKINEKIKEKNGKGQKSKRYHKSKNQRKTKTKTKRRLSRSYKYK